MWIQYNCNGCSISYNEFKKLTPIERLFMVQALEMYIQEHNDAMEEMSNKGG